VSSDPHTRGEAGARGVLVSQVGPSEGVPLRPIELAIAEEEPDREAREFIAELVDVREELSELFDGDD
jgi:hypothetical protein